MVDHDAECVGLGAVGLLPEVAAVLASIAAVRAAVGEWERVALSLDLIVSSGAYPAGWEHL